MILIFLFIVIVGGALGLGLAGALFGGEDPYERRLYEMDEHDYMVDELSRRQGNTNIDVDARSISFHQHNHK